MSGLRRARRLALLAALLIGGLLVETLSFWWIGARGRERAVRTWARLVLRACGVRLRLGAAPGAVRPDRLPGGCMLVANHVSWLDIVAIDAAAPSEFVAKAEIRRWPLVGLLCRLAGTHFIERHRRHAVRDVVGQLAAALRAGRRVAVFPEGTTNDGATLLRFHANLLQAAIDANAPVVPVALRYGDAGGVPAQAVRYVDGVTFGQSLWRILAEPAIEARVVAMAPLDSASAPTRHALARQAEAAIGQAIGLPDTSSHAIEPPGTSGQAIGPPGASSRTIGSSDAPAGPDR